MGTADYREMYYRLFRATEEAIQLLIRVQEECEELYMTAEEEDSPEE